MRHCLKCSLDYQRILVRAAPICFAAAALLPSTGLGTSKPEDTQLPRPELPQSFNIIWQRDLPHIADEQGKLHPTTIDPELQTHLDAFIAERGSPIAAVVVTDITTGRVLAMSQGRNPSDWGGDTHTALHSRFPAASLFKTVVTTAALEMTTLDADQSFGLASGCGGQDIHPNSDWLTDDRGGRMTLRRAFGHSCNSFFAKLAVNQLGLGAITRFARLLGWEQQLPTDFAMEPSRMLPPTASSSTTHTVGRFAAGFGIVGISPIHANWIMASLANKGRPRPMTLFADSNPDMFQNFGNPTLFSEDTATKILDVMRNTVEEGTASTVFGRGRYRAIAQETGGKTGTLNGKTPRGLTSLFIGVYPMSSPRIAVSSVVVLEDRYLFKAPQLAAEAILTWRDLRDQRTGMHRTAIRTDVPTHRRKHRR